MSADLETTDAALLELLTRLDAAGYEFVTVTPDTHGRVVARPRRPGPADLRDVFGWSRDFAPGDLPDEIVDTLDRAGGLERRDDRLRSRYRVSRLNEQLFLHSAYPTEAEDSVFFGPDTYRFASFIRDELADAGPFERLVDIGGGTGAGAIVAAGLGGAGEAVVTDVNAKALRLARINGAHARTPLTLVEADGLNGCDGLFDLVVANPPYIIDPAERAYRHGGDLHGGRISVEWSEAAMDRLASGGRYLLYTGAAVVDGRNEVLDALGRAAAARGYLVSARELDPDVFGDELSRPEYADVERIAVIGAVVTRPR